MTARRALALLLVALSVGACSPTYSDEEEQEVILPPPALDASPSDAAVQMAVFAGGCFWGVEAVFEHVRGVLSVVSGFAGGTAETASYEAVSSGQTGHAESVEIRFDPRVITYGKLLQIFFSVAHDPTQIDRQFPDWGRQYRSNVFYLNEEQRTVTRAYIAQLEAAQLFRAPIATRVDPLERFYMADSEHQDYVVVHPTDSYVVVYDLPKLDRLLRLFPELYRDP
jgi:peptide-methionine (S)-S-oxide reductase